MVSKQADAVGKQLFERHVDGDAFSVLDQVVAGGCTRVENAETWVVLLQLSREDGEINPCNVLVSHGSIRNSAFLLLARRPCIWDE